MRHSELEDVTLKY